MKAVLKHYRFIYKTPWRGNTGRSAFPNGLYCWPKRPILHAQTARIATADCCSVPTSRTSTDCATWQTQRQIITKQSSVAAAALGFSMVKSLANGQDTPPTSSRQACRRHRPAALRWPAKSINATFQTRQRPQHAAELGRPKPSNGGALPCRIGAVKRHHHNFPTRKPNRRHRLNM